MYFAAGLNDSCLVWNDMLLGKWWCPILGSIPVLPRVTLLSPTNSLCVCLVRRLKWAECRHTTPSVPTRHHYSMDSMDKPLPNDDPTVTLTIRLIMQGKVCTEHKTWTMWTSSTKARNGKVVLLELAVTVQNILKLISECTSCMKYCIILSYFSLVEVEKLVLLSFPHCKLKYLCSTLWPPYVLSSRL